jgi:hypothetical protein
MLLRRWIGRPSHERFHGSRGVKLQGRLHVAENGAGVCGTEPGFKGTRECRSARKLRHAEVTVIVFGSASAVGAGQKRATEPGLCSARAETKQRGDPSRIHDEEIFRGAYGAKSEFRERPPLFRTRRQVINSLIVTGHVRWRTWYSSGGLRRCWLLVPNGVCPFSIPHIVSRSSHVFPSSG